MNIRITSRKFKAKDSLKNFIRDEVKSLERFNDQILDVKVILSFTHLKDSIKTSEINLRIPGKTITVSTESDEFEKSIPIAIEKIRKQLRKIKTKRLTRPKNES
ncbi:MAG: ribosomal subunit interface protein [Ignavibacteria bacterium RIFOXYA2_FULL_37_17]|nr:MAG: ribosomal subunit interface protein [Ignavibacteria bacterium RIFOXYA2_FULL_37_17]